MRIADNLVSHCSYYRGKAEVDRSRGIHERAIRVKTAKRFSRLAYACLTGDQPMRHPCFRTADSILVKLRVFHHQHQTPVDLALPDLALPDLALPDLALPDLALPDLALPDLARPRNSRHTTFW